MNATVKGYLALKLAGVPVTDPRMLSARAMANALGGVPRMNTFSKLYLALIGLIGWDHVPTVPCEVLLIGKWFHVNFWDMSNWSRAMLVPLAIINHFRPTRPLAHGVNLDELYPNGKLELNDALRPRYFDFSLRNAFLWLDRLHKVAEGFARHGLHPFRKTALRRCEAWMIERFEGSDGLAAIFPAMLNALIALKALGGAASDVGCVVASAVYMLKTRVLGARRTARRVRADSFMTRKATAATTRGPALLAQLSA